MVEVVCQCPKGWKNCEPSKLKCDQAALLGKYALNKTATMVLGAIIGGFALAIALLFSDPIQAWVAGLGYSDAVAALVSALVFLAIAVALVIVLVFVGRSGVRTRELAAANNVALE